MQLDIQLEIYLSLGLENYVFCKHFHNVLI